jgi:hypothetical protein
MKVTELNLWVGNVNGFKFLICADDEEDAIKVAENYQTEARLDGALEVTEFSDVNTSFDCDYVVR